MSKDRSSQVASQIDKILKSAPPADRERMGDWMTALLAIRDADLSAYAKVKEAFRATKQQEAILPLMKLVAIQTKRHGWDERASGGRWLVAASGLAIAVFGLQGAGIAAFGGAIGLPLWVVLGSGAAVAKIIVDEINVARAKDSLIEVPAETEVVDPR